MKSKYFLFGAKVGLRPVTIEDYLTKYKEWLSDSEVTHFLFRGVIPVTDTDLRREFESMDGKTDVVWAVCDLETGAIAGIAGLHSINWVARHAEFRILLGAKEFWGKGFGTESTMLLTAYGFERLNLNKVWLGVNSDNLGAYRTYVKSDFVLEGELREEFYRNGRFYHVKRMSLLRPEYEVAKGKWPIYSNIQSQMMDAKA